MKLKQKKIYRFIFAVGLFSFFFPMTVVAEEEHIIDTNEHQLNFKLMAPTSVKDGSEKNQTKEVGGMLAKLNEQQTAFLKGLGLILIIGSFAFLFLFKRNKKGEIQNETK